MLNYCTHIFCQDEASIRLLKDKLNFTNASLSGDTRYDTVLQAKQLTKELSIINAFKNEELVFIGGSTYAKEDEFILNLFNKEALSELKFIVVPHDIDINYCQNLKNRFNNQAALYSELIGEKEATNYRVLIVDKVGLLLQLYNYADFALVGGGFGKGIHNTLEAAVQGIPVFGGPNWQKSIEVKELQDIDCFIEVNSAKDLAEKIKTLLKNKAVLLDIKENSKKHFEEKIGATNKIYKQLSSIIN